MKLITTFLIIILMIGIVSAIGVEVDAKVKANGGAGNGENNSIGIGQELKLQIEAKRTEYRSGNFTTSLGQYLNVREIVSGMLELRENNVSVKTKLNLTKSENGEDILEAELNNGSRIEIKVMPSRASETAIAKLKIKACDESNNCTIELKEVGKNKEARLAYQVKAEKKVKVLGLFKAKANIETNVNAETGEIISSNVPWWVSISSKS